MNGLRTPFFIAALALIVLAVLVEIGSDWLPKTQVVAKDLDSQLSRIQGVGKLSASASGLTGESPPGLAIPAMAFMDGLVAFTAVLMGLPFLLTDRIQGRLVGIVSCVVSFLVLLAAILVFFRTLAELLLMLALVAAVPFGTMAYLAMWGSFATGQAAALLGLLLMLKLGFTGCLLAAQQRFLQNKGLIFILLTSFIANFVISFLHGFVPGPLVSITDAVAALIVLILAAIWAVLMLVFGIISAIKAVV
jgi:hypothetical protein